MHTDMSDSGGAEEVVSVGYGNHTAASSPLADHTLWLVIHTTLYGIALVLNTLMAARVLYSYTPLPAHAFLELNILVANIVDASLFFGVQTVSRWYALPLNYTMRQLPSYKHPGCQGSERWVILVNLGMYQHLATLSLTNMMGLTLCIYVTYIYGTHHLMDQARALSFVIIGWMMSLLLIWSPMLIRCLYADAIYLVAVFWLTPLLVFVVFCGMMQIILLCRSSAYYIYTQAPTTESSPTHAPPPSTSSTTPRPTTPHDTPTRTLSQRSTQRKTTEHTTCSQKSSSLQGHPSEASMASSHRDLPGQHDVVDLEYPLASVSKDTDDLTPPPLTKCRIMCLCLTQAVVTCSMLPFLMFQLFDLMNIPSEPIDFWLSPVGKATLCILQSLPAVHFAFQPFMMMVCHTSCHGNPSPTASASRNQDNVYDYTYSNNTCVITSI